MFIIRRTAGIGHSCTGILGHCDEGVCRLEVVGSSGFRFCPTFLGLRASVDRANDPHELLPLQVSIRSDLWKLPRCFSQHSGLSGASSRRGALVIKGLQQPGVSHAN